MAIGCSAVSATWSAFFRFGGFFLAYQSVLPLLFWREANEERGIGAERDFVSPGSITEGGSPLPDRRHTADAEVPLIRSSTLPWTIPARADVGFTGSQGKGSMGTPVSQGGVGGGSSAESRFSSWGV